MCNAKSEMLYRWKIAEGKNIVELTIIFSVQ